MADLLLALSVVKYACSCAASPALQGTTFSLPPAASPTARPGAATLPPPPAMEGLEEVPESEEDNVEQPFALHNIRFNGLPLLLHQPTRIVFTDVDEQS